MAIAVLLLVAMGGFLLIALTVVDHATADLNSHWLPAVRALSETKYEMESHRLRFVRAVNTPTAGDRDAIFGNAAERETEIDAALQSLAAYAQSPEARGKLDAIDRAWRLYIDKERAIRDALPTLSASGLADQINNDSRALFDAVNDAVNAMIEFDERGANRAGAAAVATFDRAVQIALALLICMLILLALYVGLVVTSVSQPIERIIDAMGRLAAGDSEIALQSLHRDDEMGRMAAAVEVFRNTQIERDAARLALERANESLEQRIEARSSELRIANASLTAEVEERKQANEQLRSMQDELVRTENLAVVGQLSAGIAHELNQPLAALATLSQNAVRFLDLGDEETVRHNLDRIVRLVDRMGVLTSRLRSFARRTGEERESIDLARSVENALALIDHHPGKGSMRIETRPPAEPVLVFANAVRIEQILVNLLSNAFDATRQVPEALAEIAWRRDGDFAALTVRDNGSGFEPGILEHIFAPFFTTKKGGGSGLGLGLAISANIARAFGGALNAADAPNGGAIFTLTLPIAKAGPAEEASAAGGGAGEPDGAGPANPENRNSAPPPPSQLAEI
jgi:C4-dicarboxylate-specific signal transduction histidine kinase